MAATTMKRAEMHGVGARFAAVEGDMFTDPWPAGHDAIVFGNIFHDWSPDTCKELARKAFEALPRGGRVVLQEILLDDDKLGPPLASVFSWHMLMNERDMNGRQYSARELTELLESAGFVDIEPKETLTPYSAVSGRKP